MRPSPERTAPEYRKLRIYAIDPMLARGGDHQATVQVRYEPLEVKALSFAGRRVEVVDVDTSVKPPIWLKPVHLDDAHIAMQQGLEPSESDPQFHQQMVYAVALRTLEQFDRALGRVVYFSGRRRLRLVPHAFRGANAFYHPRLRAVLFGYFRASEDSPGENLPGQTIFTCLSHDIIAHEVTHAIVDRLRPHFSAATNPHVRAFHEAFSDIVAIFQRLTFEDIVRQALEEGQGRLEDSPLTYDVAAQLGQGMGSGGALRRALDETTRMTDVSEEHDLGAVLVAAIFDAFLKTYRRRTADLVRLATGGTGVLPRGALHPDLLARLTAECTRTAQGVLTMCIRALDYLPPADVDFGAFLRALVTADWELDPLDEGGLRAAVIESCRRRGIFAAEAGSLSVGALLLDSVRREDWLSHEEAFRKWVDLAVRIGAEEQRNGPDDDDARDLSSMASASEVERPGPASMFAQAGPVSSSAAVETGEDEVDAAKSLRASILAWFGGLPAADRRRLGLPDDADVRSIGFQPSYRVASDGTLRFGLFVQLVHQKEVLVEGVTRRLPIGATLVIDVTGQLRFLLRARPPELRQRDVEATALRAATNALGWRLAGAAPNPFEVDYRGMHEGRM